MAATPLWHLAQPLMMPTWLILGCAEPDGAGLAGLPAGPAGVAAGAAVVAGVVAGAVAALAADVLLGTVAPAKLTVLWWQVAHGALVTI